MEVKTEIFLESFFESIFEFFFDFMKSTDSGPWKVDSAILAKNGTDELFRGVGCRCIKPRIQIILMLKLAWAAQVLSYKSWATYFDTLCCDRIVIAFVVEC